MNSRSLPVSMRSLVSHVAPLFDARSLSDFERELVDALYEQRYYEKRILSYEPQSSAPSELVTAFTASKLKVMRIECDIRRRRHGY
jgi:hypothetical protein